MLDDEVKAELHRIGVECDNAEDLEQVISDYWDNGDGADLVDLAKRLERIGTANKDWDFAKEATDDLFDAVLRLKDFYESETLRQANDKERMWKQLKQ